MPAPHGALGPHSLRGLTHPLRVRILSLLREHGASTATRLADRLGESSGATSYHLRQLAAYGFVEDVPGRGARRERWWRTVARRNDNAVHLRAAAADGFERLHGFLTGAANLPPEWQPGVTIDDVTLRLTPAQAADLLSQIGELLDGYPAADATSGSEKTDGRADEKAAVTASSGRADITATSGRADITATSGRADVIATSGRADVIATSGKADIADGSGEADVAGSEEFVVQWQMFPLLDRKRQAVMRNQR